MSKMIVVGLTGPMGSGKSAVAKTFVELGYKLVDADAVARKVVEKDSPTLRVLAENFGDDVLNADGTLNRRLLAQRAFSTKEGTQKLNSITHPAIIEMVKSEILRFEKEGFTKVVYDAPLLFESNSNILCDFVVSVIAPKQQRIVRVKLRDNLSVDEIEDRISAQYDDTFYTEKSDYVIYNDGSVAELMTKTHSIIKALEVHNGTL